MAPHIVASHIQGAVSGAVFHVGAIVPPHRIVGIRVMIHRIFSIGDLSSSVFAPFPRFPRLLLIWLDSAIMIRLDFPATFNRPVFPIVRGEIHSFPVSGDRTDAVERS
jgi:hypothetical protein